MERKRSLPKDDFPHLLLSWSHQHIFDQNLYQSQVETIPESFGSVDRYLDSYVYPLLEETRAELASALETAYNAPFAKVTQIKESEHEKLVYNVKVDFWRKRRGDSGREPHRILPGDFVLLSDSKPERLLDAYTFASVMSNCEDENSKFSSSDFKLKTGGSIDKQHKSLYVVYLMNLTTNKRIWMALKMRRNMRIIEQVLTVNDSGEGDCEYCPLNVNDEVEEKFGATLLSKLNESQLESVLASTRKIRCRHKSSVQLVWGPPGTGKTTMLSSLLHILLRMNVRTLICAPTNIAIKELASRVTGLLRNSVEESLCCPLGDILIFGNKDRLDVGSDVEDIFLDYRAERLLDCLGPQTGWRQCIASMLNFLEDCVSQHRIFVDSERIEAKSFLEFVRGRFRDMASALRRCILTFYAHLPRSCLNELNFQSVVELMSLLDSMETLFEDSTMTSDRLEAIFLETGLIGPESSDDKSSLMYLRSRCLSILRSLLASINKLGLTNLTSRKSTMDYCLQKASLVFCTTSSSYKLHNVDHMDPFQLLVVDEAAQVKECETLIALQIPDVRHAVLVGDEKQLPATIKSKLSEEAGFGRSLFERLSSLGQSKHLLNVQYRMHPEISRFPNSNFYHNQILDAPNVQSESYKKSYLEGSMFGPFSFINVRGGKEEFDEVGHSRRNMVEVSVTLNLVQKIFDAWSISKEKLSIGLISPYTAQVAAIRDRLQSKYENLEGFTVKVKSIDGFQGIEEDIIIISTVRSHKGGCIGFLSSPLRTNVALTRARHCLWILGNESTLSKSDSVWEALISDAKSRQCFFNADEDRDIEKTIIDAKKEFHQLEDLLSAENVLFQNSRWQVLFSDDFRKSFEKLNSSMKKMVINLLLKLARGWRPKKAKVDEKCAKSSYILKQFKVMNYYVICSIDIIKEFFYKQVLKVWDISHLPLVKTCQLFKRLDNIASMYTDDFINHCNEKLFEGNLEVPKSWTCSHCINRFKNPNTAELSKGASASNVDGLENSKVNESLLLMKFYSLSIGTVNHLLSDLELDLPFEVTDEERQIIIFPGSSFILGRSGTGKTTVLVMKLYRRIQQLYIASRCPEADDNRVRICNSANVHQHIDESSLHQLFVTVSPKLCHVVKKHVSELKSFATQNSSGYNNLTDVDEAEEIEDFRDIPDTFVGIHNDKYPLIITFHKFLMMLDGTLGNSYFQRFRDVRGSTHYDGTSSIALQTFIRKNEVTYDRFQSFYWPHFNAKLTKNLDASRVFTEIMSHIKGGTQEGGSCDCMLSRETYISLSESRVSTLSADTRSVIYDIFQDYERKKLHRGEFDVADFVNNIHLRLKNEVLVGDKMDFVYIDEVQDLSMRQISLFRHICKNVDEGFVFSGDTAQTIARGIDFRFEDIRSLFYNEFLMKSRNGDMPGRSNNKGLMSEMFTLSQNFRTHTGVLRLAQSVIDLICYYFPHSIDSLPRETSLVYGESPIVLEPSSDESLIISIFGKSGAKWAGFGADQVILVRDDAVKKEIFSYIGHQATILTILECKGLEFQDVLLYNFFSSSPLSDQWRVVYEFFEEKDGDSRECFPSFSQSRHHILCSELKQLYVAITRAKQRLWICENNAELSTPMLDYWRRLCLVQVKKVDDSLAKEMQRTSSREEWKAQGIKLFWEKNYEMAIMCFEKAGEETWEKRAKASALRAASESLRYSNSEEANAMLREAAEIFDSIDRVESAAECFCDLGDYKRAGRIYLDKCGVYELRKAGECFYLAGSYKTAAKVYAKGNFFRECLSSCMDGKHLDLGLQYIEHWKEHASFNSEIAKEISKISDQFLEKCALESYKAKDIASMMKFVRCFHSLESKRNFLTSVNCLEELLALEEELGNFNEAAEIAKSIGEILREIDLLEKTEQYSNACLLILLHVLSNSLWISGNRGWPMKSFPKKVELLNRAMYDAHKVSENFHASISAEVKILLNEQCNMSELMQHYSASKKNDAPICEFLCLRKVLDAHFQMNPRKYVWDPEMHLDSSSFDGRIMRNQLSAGTLVYLWNLWKEQSLKMVKCVDGLEKLDFIKPEGTVRLCFNYFGVRLVDNFCSTLLLLNPDAAWLRDEDSAFVRRSRKTGALETRYFVSAARSFCYQELVFVGHRVLTALQRLYWSSVEKGLSKRCQSMCLLHIYDIAKYFLQSRSFVLKNVDLRKMQCSLQLSTKYFNLVFPLDPRDSLSGDMISLRETRVSRNLLEEIVSRNVSTENALTYGQVGRSVMIMLGTGRLEHDLYDRIGEKLSGNTWKAFVHLVKGWSDSEMFREFHKALEDTYNLDQRVHDYISPDCFFYLLERLLILVPHPQGHFFTAKSSFVEHLMCLPSDVSFVMDMEYDHESIVNFVVMVIMQLLYDNDLTRDWIESSDIDFDYYYPVLVLRLLVVLCLSCLNWDLDLDVLSEMLALPHVGSCLPREFYEALEWNHTSFLNAVIRAFAVIGDPLVIVASRELKLKYTHPDAVFLDLGSFSSRDEILKTLFPRSTKAETSRFQPPIVKRNNTRTRCRGVTPAPSEFESNMCSPETGNGGLQIKWGLFREMIDAFEDQNGGNLKSHHVLTKKVEVEDHIKLLKTAVGQLVEQRYHSGEDMCEAVSMVEELGTLCSMLIPSDFDLKGVTGIGEVLKSFEARRTQLDMLLSKCNDPKGSVVPKEIDSTKSSDRKHDVVHEVGWTSKKGKGRRM